MPYDIAGRAPTQGSEIEVQAGVGVRTPGRRYGFVPAAAAAVKGPEVEHPPEPGGALPPAVAPALQTADPAPTSVDASVYANKSAQELIEAAGTATTREDLDAIEANAQGRVTVLNAVGTRRAALGA